MMEPCCSSPKTVTCLFSDSGSDRWSGTPNVFTYPKRDFRAQWKCVCTVSALISLGGERGGVPGQERRALKSCNWPGRLPLGYSANLKWYKSVFRSEIYQTTKSESKWSRNCSEVRQILNTAWIKLLIAWDCWRGRRVTSDSLYGTISFSPTVTVFRVVRASNSISSLTWEKKT